MMHFEKGEMHLTALSVLSVRIKLEGKDRNVLKAKCLDGLILKGQNRLAVKNHFEYIIILKKEFCQFK